MKANEMQTKWKNIKILIERANSSMPYAKLKREKLYPIQTTWLAIDGYDIASSVMEKYGLMIPSNRHLHQ